MYIHSSAPTGEDGSVCAKCGANVEKGGIVSEDGRLYCTKCDSKKQPAHSVGQVVCCHCGAQIKVVIEARRSKG
jgi:hypothetical protein